MDLDIARQWTAALRSGEYQQGVGKLNQNGKFCCLGVLCELYPDGDLVKTYGGVSKEGFNGIVTYDGVSSLPPARVRNWAGLDTEYGDLPLEDKNGGVAYLTKLNDDGMTFDQIADLIDYFAKDM